MGASRELRAPTAGGAGRPARGPRRRAAVLAPLLALAAGLVAPPSAADVRIRVETDYGDFDMWLLEHDAPQHVFNFLAYLEDGDYDDLIFHRLARDFVLQTGGFKVAPLDDPDIDFDYSLGPVPTDPSIPNEFGRTNSAGTVSLAKVGGNPNSGTSQWFVNLADNGVGTPSDLDSQNGGFTVFGCLADPTLAVPLAINEVEVVNLSSFFGDNFGTVPFEDYVPPAGGDFPDMLEVVDLDLTRVPAVERPCPGCDRKAKGPLVAKLKLGELGKAKQTPDVKFKLYGDHWTAKGDGIDLRGTLVPHEDDDRKFDLLPDACGMQGVRELLASLGAELVGEDFSALTDDPAPSLTGRLNKRKTKWTVRAEWPVTGSDGAEGSDPIPGTLVLKGQGAVSKLD
ncbi:MAG: peptidylprolyl isomerase [Myxococcota bacterium]